jgi:hypothetical protein
MSNIDRWRNWRPPGKKADEATERSLPKLTQLGSFMPQTSSYTDCVGFGGLVPRQAPEFCCSTSDPAAWKEDFHRWMLGRCTYKGRCFGGIEELYCDFRGWSIHHKEAPCTAAGFVQLLSEAGFFFANGLVSGVVLREDRAICRGTQETRRNAK